jgi:hypothetical protein
MRYTRAASFRLWVLCGGSALVAIAIRANKKEVYDREDVEVFAVILREWRRKSDPS